MPAALRNKLGLCLLIALPAVILRITGVHGPALLDVLIFGAAIVAAAFMLAWAAEAARKDMAGAFAIALLALVAVLPEYAVDLLYSFKAGSDPEYTQYAAANMTGSNRLLLGFGWPLIVLVALFAVNRAFKAKSGTKPKKAQRANVLRLPIGSRLDVGVLAILAIVAFAIPIMGSIPIWFGILLIAAFTAYLWRASRAENDGEEEFVGTSLLIAELPTPRRKAVVWGSFGVAALIIVFSAERFAEGLVSSGSALGIDSYFLVQWLAPLASESPEFIVAVLFALRGWGAAAIGTLIAAKINQWSLLVGSLPVAYWAGGGGTSLPLDDRQVEEFLLTATQTVLGVAIILGLVFYRWQAYALLSLFAVQFVVTGIHGRYILSFIHLGIAAVLFYVHRRDILPSLKVPFQRAADDSASPDGGELATQDASRST